MNAAAWASAVRGTGRYLKRLERAREIDPDAFKPTMIPHFTPEQLNRQAIAMQKADSDRDRDQP